MNQQLPAIPPGEILLEEFLKPMALSQNQLARDVGVPPGRINDIIRGKRSITRDTPVDLWINLQARYDAKIATREMVPLLSRTIRRRVKSAA